MIQISGLNKTFNIKKNGIKVEVSILNDINIEIATGEIVALLGHNGSGKSTLIKCITGVLKPNKGQVMINGMDTFKKRKKLIKSMGVIFNQKPSFIVDLSVKDNLDFFKAIYSINDEDFESALNLIDKHISVKDLLLKQYRKLSFGERVKCEITSILLHNPKYIIMDEPTIGLDYNAKKGLYQLLDHYNKVIGSTIIITTHEVDYIERICNKAIILDKGCVRYCGSPSVITNVINRVITVQIGYDKKLNIEKANKILSDAIEHNEKEQNFIYTFQDEAEKDKWLSEVVTIFSISKLNINSTSLREVFEDVLAEIS